MKTKMKKEVLKTKLKKEVKDTIQDIIIGFGDSYKPPDCKIVDFLFDNVFLQIYEKLEGLSKDEIFEKLKDSPNKEIYYILLVFNKKKSVAYVAD